MNHVMTTVRTPNPSTTLVTITAASTGKPSLLHRVELRIALWLLLRSSRRQGDAPDHGEHHRRRLHREARARREQAALRAWCTQCIHH